MPKGLTIDGVSQKQVLLGKAPMARDEIFVHAPVNWPQMTPSTTLRKGDWKLIRFYFGNEDNSDRYELYNLEQDLGEKNNLAAQEPERVKKLSALMDQRMKETGSPLPTLNKEYAGPQEKADADEQ